MAPVLGLFVIVGVEVDVVDNDSVGRRQVDAESSGSGRQQKNEYAAVLHVLVDEFLALAHGSAAVHPQVFVLADLQVVFHHVQHDHVLAEHEDSVSGLLQFGEKFVQVQKFTGGQDQIVWKNVAL